jgi:CxxC-x17-CxxC domain-containing protein
MSDEKPNRQMWKAVCSKCGKHCEVPFEPTEGKPVKCMDCYKESRPVRNFGPRRDNFQKRSFKAECAECGAECSVPFKPNGKKPVLCLDCYKKSKGLN